AGDAGAAGPAQRRFPRPDRGGGLPHQRSAAAGGGRAASEESPSAHLHEEARPRGALPPAHRLRQRSLRAMPDLSHESRWRAEGETRFAGIGGAGRGPLGGPVVAAAVVLPQDYAHAFLNDSKQVAEARREALYEEITSDPRIAWASARVEAEEID